MKKYYELNPDSPFYYAMQNTENEQKLSEEEKQEIYEHTMNIFAINGLEGFEYSEDERNYFIYAFLNSISDEEMERILLKNNKDYLM